jgi:hypothetical protein
MLISEEVDILACELGIFSLKIGKNLGFLALGMVPFTGTSYIRKKTLTSYVFYDLSYIVNLNISYCFTKISICYNFRVNI